MQGVGFRWAILSRARSLRVTGWARNREDGAVEAVFEGPEEHVESMVEWCRRGPGHAVVEEITVEWGEPAGESEFSVR